jgi:hypothetical protein
VGHGRQHEQSEKVNLDIKKRSSKLKNIIQFDYNLKYVKQKNPQFVPQPGAKNTDVIFS